MSTTKKASAKRGGLPEDDGLDAFAAAAAGAFAAPPPTRRRRSGSAGAAPNDPAAVSVPSSAAASAPLSAPASVPAPVAETDPAGESGTEPDSAPAPGAAMACASSSVPGHVVPATWPEPAPVSSAPAALRVPRLGESGQEPTQCTVMVSAQVRKRFAAYQLAQKLSTGREPTNAVVVRRAVIHVKKHDLFASLLEAVRHRQQPAQEEDFDADGLFGDVPARRTERGAVKDGRQQSFRPSKQELAVIDAFTVAYGFPNRSDFLNGALDAFLPPLQEGRPRNR